MAKFLLEDMVKAKRERKGIKTVKKIDPPPPVQAKEIKVKSSDSKPRTMLWFVALFSVGFCFFAFSVFFSKAEITVSPKIVDVTLKENLSATKDSNTNLSFNLIVIDGLESKTIQAAEEKDVKEYAKGTVVVYNAFSSSAQALNIDTRLEGSNGKIYKTQTKLVVPGMSKNGTPGSVEVGIYGAEVGEGYNSTPLDFKILGFKGTPKYAKFYARSKGDIKGGFIGKAPVVSDTEKVAAIKELKTALQVKLLKKATDQIPEGFVLFKDAVFLNTDDSNVSFTYNKDNSMTITDKGTLYGILFNEQKLTKKIVDSVVKDYDGNDVFISNIKDLSFTLVNEGNVAFADLKDINFNLSGPAKIVWKLDEDKFTTDLLGKSKDDFNSTVAQYPNIESANLTLKPRWKMSIPNETKNVKILVNYPQ
ncbi:MAG: hypothetical protein WCT44_04075 [Candidatus Paceibacterota bacterium]